MLDALAKDFVPIAANLYEIREKTHPAYWLYESLQKQKDNYQGLWIATPDGKLLGAFMDWPNRETDWTETLLTTLARARKAFGPSESRTPGPGANLYPSKGIGKSPDGNYHVAGLSRAVFNKGETFSPPDLERVVLTPTEFLAFAPPTMTVGAEYAIRGDGPKKFSPLMTTGCGHNAYPEPTDVTGVELFGRVSAVANGQALVWYQGRIASQRESRFDKGKIARGEGKFFGYATFDVSTRAMLRLRLFLDTSYRNYPPYDGPQPMLGLAEWRAK